MADADNSKGPNIHFGGVGCLSMCVLAGFIFWMCTGFWGCHNVGGWFEKPINIHVEREASR